MAWGLSTLQLAEQLAALSSSSSSSFLTEEIQANTTSYYDHDILKFMETIPEEPIRRQTPASWSFYAFLTPLIIVLGFIGNTISLRVFTSTRLRDLSASCYLAALSASDNVVLLTFVLFDWLKRGLPYWKEGTSVDLIHRQGLCQSFLFVSYLSRFISVYLIVIFTIERYIAVCRPLQRRAICTKSFAKRLLVGVNIVGAVLCCYKPLISGMYAAATLPNLSNINTSSNGAGTSNWLYFGLGTTNETTNETTNTTADNPTDYFSWFTPDHNLNSSDSQPNWLSSYESNAICTWNPKYKNINFYLDLSYGLLITAIPLVLVAIFNFLMLKQLISRHYLSQRTVRNVFRKNKIRIELTVTVLAVSTCFVCLNIPYLFVWLRQNLQAFNPDGAEVVQRNSDSLIVTRTVFSINYSINFFVYCLTGSYYRGILSHMFCMPKKKVRQYSNYNSRQTQRSMVSMLTNSTEL